MCHYRMKMINELKNIYLVDLTQIKSNYSSFIFENADMFFNIFPGTINKGVL